MVRSSNTCPADVVVDKDDSLLHRNRILSGSDASRIEINRVRDNKRRNYQKKKNIAVSAIKALQCSSRATDDANNNNNNNNNNNSYVYDNFDYKKDDEEEKRRKKEQQQQKQKLDDSNDDNDGGAVRFGNFTANFELDNGSYDTLDKAFIWGKRAINPDEETNNTIVMYSEQQQQQQQQQLPPNDSVDDLVIFTDDTNEDDDDDDDGDVIVDDKGNIVNPYVAEEKKYNDDDNHSHNHNDASTSTQPLNPLIKQGIRQFSNDSNETPIACNKSLDDDDDDDDGDDVNNDIYSDDLFNDDNEMRQILHHSLSLGDTLSPTDGNDHYYYESNYDRDSPQIDRTARVQGIIDNTTESDFANYDMTRTTTKTMNNHMLHDQQDCHVPNQRQQEQEKQVQLQIPELPTDEESRRLSSFYEVKNTLKKWRFKSPFDSDNNRSSNIHGPPPPPPPPDLTNFGMAISIPANNNKPSPSTSSEVDENIIDDTTSFITTSTTVSSFILPSNNNSSLSSDNNNNNNNNNNHHYKSISTAKYKYYLQQQKRNSSSNSNSNSGITRNNKVTAAIAPVTIRTPVLLGFFWKTHPLLTTVIDSDNDNYSKSDAQFQHKIS